MGKYNPLKNYFKSFIGDTWHAHFEEIEVIIDSKLPPSARKHPEWWSNATNSHPYAQAWLAEGWKSEDIDLGSEKITFTRIKH